MSGILYEKFERNGQLFVRGQRHDIPADIWEALLEGARWLKECPDTSELQPEQRAQLITAIMQGKTAELPDNLKRFTMEGAEV